MAGAPLVLITGASSGIGQALAQRYRADGWRVALVARRAAELQAWAQAQGWGAEVCAVYAADVRDPASITAAGRACLGAQGLPDVVIANAGISVGIDTAIYEDLEVMRATLETNVLGMAATFHPFVGPMRARRAGTLVGIASVAGIRGLPGHGAYCSSKAAAISYCESLRGELRADGVKVVTLVPGYVDTPLTQQNRYSMPFLLRPEAFAQRAFDAIRVGASYRVIPWQMGLVAKLLRLLPNALFDRALAGRPRKHRQGGGAAG
ncbi:MAG: SDR family oxidoreductase [Piscinibacter sp.]|nr:SDR family oxidoreductase [Piscinibacter sp.]